MKMIYAASAMILVSMVASPVTKPVSKRAIMHEILRAIEQVEKDRTPERRGDDAMALAHELAHAAQFNRLGAAATLQRATLELNRDGPEGVYVMPAALEGQALSRFNVVDSRFTLEALAQRAGYAFYF